jgi:HK97 family phage major capsid protein
MNRREQRSALINEAKNIMKAAADGGRDLTNEEITRSTEIKGEVATLTKAIEAGDAAREGLKGILGAEYTTTDASEPSMKAVAIGGGAQAPLAKALMQAMNERPEGAKAVTVSAGSVSVPANFGVVGQPQDANLLSNIVAFVEQTASGQQDAPDGVSFLQQVTRTLAAQAVERGAPKPESALSFRRVNQAFATLAHIISVPNQWLQDSSKLGQLIQSEMVYGVMLAIDELLLNDTLDENGDTLHGILTTTGVGRTAFAGDAVRTVRRALGKLEAQGITPTHVAMNPTDWEEIETTRLTDGAYLLADRPGGSRERRLWNTSVVLASGLAAGTAVAGDFSTQSIGVATRGPVTLQWNPFSKDTTNETILRVEGRFSPVLTRPAAFEIATLAGA